MNITLHHLEQDAHQHPKLVAEREIKYEDAEHLSTPEIIARILIEEFGAGKMYSEHAWLWAVNSDLKPLSVSEISKGGLSESLIDPRIVFTTALLSGAAATIFCHSHPSGSVTESKPDLQITRRLLECGKLLGIPLLDSIIVGGRNFKSLRETTDLFEK